MNISDVQHHAAQPFCYAVDAHTVRVVVRTAVDAYDSVRVLWRDRAVEMKGTRELPPSQEKELSKFGTDGEYDYFTCTMSLKVPRFWYVFCLRKGSVVKWLGEEETAGSWLNQWGYCYQTPDSTLRHDQPSKGPQEGFHIPYVNPGDIISTPKWLKGCTVYELLPDRFANGDTDNDPEGVVPWGSKPDVNPAVETGGDIAGIRQNLPYLKELGIGALYTTPLFTSPTSHKYDTSDYERVDPSFGTNDDLKELVNDLHAEGMRFIMEGVFNHCGEEFWAFKEVVDHGADSKYVTWFAGFDSFPVDKQAINYVTFGDGYGSMPKLNTADPKCQAYFLGVVRRWITELGINGWRFDVADEVDHGFLRKVRQTVKELDPDIWLLGEMWHEAGPWLQGDQLDSVMNYPWGMATLKFLSGREDAMQYVRRVTRQLFWYPSTVQGNLMTVIGSHDTPRYRGILGKARARLGAILQFTHLGVPMVYYGDEVGMEGADDPYCRQCMDWSKESWDQETFALYQKLIGLRKEKLWLADGSWKPVYADPGSNVLAIERTDVPLYEPTERASERLVVIVNPNQFPARVPISIFGSRLVSYDYLTERHLDLSSGYVKLEPYQGVILM